MPKNISLACRFWFSAIKNDMRVKRHAKTWLSVPFLSDRLKWHTCRFWRSLKNGMRAFFDGHSETTCVSFLTVTQKRHACRFWRLLKNGMRVFFDGHSKTTCVSFLTFTQKRHAYFYSDISSVDKVLELQELGNSPKTQFWNPSQRPGTYPKIVYLLEMRFSAAPTPPKTIESNGNTFIA